MSKQYYESSYILSDFELEGLSFPDMPIISYINKALADIAAAGDYPKGIDYKTFKLTVDREDNGENFAGLTIRASVISK